MEWQEFEARNPELAAFGKDRFDRTGLVILGTLRRDGLPRISPVEFLLLEGRLYLGMEWQSRKALDLQRDPRCSLLNAVHDKNGSDGEFKLYGRAIEVTGVKERGRFARAIFEKLGFDLGNDPYHLFAIDIDSAAFAVLENETWRRGTWRSQDETTG